VGIAGGGADEQARRAARRVERLRNELTAAERREHAWTTGAEGERLVASTLAELPGWQVLHDVHWPGRPRANLDHVAVGPGGVVVIDAKNWSGRVSVRDGVLRCQSWRKDKELEAIAGATAAVAALLPPAHRATVRGVLCIVRQDVVATTTTLGVIVVGRSRLVGHLLELDRRLSDAEVTATATLLRSALDGPRSPVLVTTADVPSETPAQQEPPARARRRPVPRARPLPTRPTALPRSVRKRPAVQDALLRLLFALVILWFAVTIGPGVLAHVIDVIIGSALPTAPG